MNGYWKWNGSHKNECSEWMCFHLNETTKYTSKGWFLCMFLGFYIEQKLINTTDSVYFTTLLLIKLIFKQKNRIIRVTWWNNLRNHIKLSLNDLADVHTRPRVKSSVFQWWLNGHSVEYNPERNNESLFWRVNELYSSSSGVSPSLKGA